MARRSRGMQPLQYISVFVLFVVGLYALVFFTGDKKHIPHLGIDLRSGTRVVLTARTPDGKDPSQESLNLAKDIIEKRVNGLGIAGSEVVVQGNNLVITVPGEQGEAARSLGQTAKLYIRPVAKNPLNGQAMEWNKAESPDLFKPPPPDTPAPTPTSGEPSPSPSPAPPAPTSGEPSPAPPAPSSTPPSPANNSPDVSDEEAKAIQAARALRQSPDLLLQMDPQTMQNPQAMAQLKDKITALEKAIRSLDCSKPDPLRGNDDPNLPLVTCSQDGNEKLVLEKSILDGQEIANASAGYDNQRGSGWFVNLDFKSAGQKIWSDYTAAHNAQADPPGTQTAITLDSRVISHPTIESAINGPTQITGKFTADEARQLANVLKYGSLPLSFSSSEAQTISATLGLASLKAGLIAGGVGLLLVLLYCLFYYRALGFLALLSLVLTGVANYAIVVLLGRWIGFTLDLAGIAGFIIGIGMTADSFVVYFERIKDEVREGRSFRSAVPRAWERARRTILSGNAVTFIAAVVLYSIAIGEVRGFAFTLGLTTIMDLVVVFLVTHPLVHAVSTRQWWSKPSRTGLGRVRRQAASS